MLAIEIDVFVSGESTSAIDPELVEGDEALLVKTIQVTDCPLVEDVGQIASFHTHRADALLPGFKKKDVDSVLFVNDLIILVSKKV
jgi:hypothetical protein